MGAAPGRVTVRGGDYTDLIETILHKAIKDVNVVMINRGVSGELAANAATRMKNEVALDEPDLVLWQVGTNSVLRDRSLAAHEALLHEGIEELKASGADVVLIDPQYAPKVLAASETPGMVDQIALAAKAENVDLFHRFAIMRNWHENQHLPFEAFVTPDQLHMNDWG